MMVTGKRNSIFVAIAILCASFPCRVWAQALAEEPLRIPMHEAGSQGLEAFMVRPADEQAHPLALLTHGAPRDPGDRADITALSFVPQAREFARRGWTTVIVIRRGYGSSGGRYAEDARACSSHPDYSLAGRESAKDLRSSIDYLSKAAHVDPSRILSVGVSAGGFANVALTADPPANLTAAISFAGGRGSRAADEVCNADALIRTFGEYGRTSRIPMLWIYAENDHFFGPQLAASFYRAFTQSGGQASLIRAAAFRRDGHGLFSGSGIPLWTPMVDSFLAAHDLKLTDDLLPLPVAPDVAPPPSLPAQARSEWRDFLTYPGHSAFAISGTGHYAYVYGRTSDQEARKQALERCKQNAPRGDRCELAVIAAGAAQR